jgi:hypothetical protein
VKTRVVEARGGVSWGHFLIARFTDEWGYRSRLDTESRMTLLRQLGWAYQHLLVVDLSTGEGAVFRHGGCAAADLKRKHPLYVTPLFAPFLAWLYQQDVADLDALPDVVALDVPADWPWPIGGAE